MTSKKLYIKTHGCQMNEYDSAKIADLLADEDNFELTTNEHEADLMVLNTCSIREKAQEKVFHQIGRWKKIKDKNPNLKIAIGGCVASQEGEKIIKRAPTVDIVFGPQSLHKLPKLYNERVNNETRQVDISFPKLRNFHISHRTAKMSHLHSCQLWRVAINTVHFVWFLILEGMRYQDQSKKSWRKYQCLQIMVLEKSIS